LKEEEVDLMHKGCALLRIFTLLAVFGLMANLLVASGAEPLSHESLAKLVLTVDDVRSVLEQEDWVVRSPAEPLLFEPEGSITAAAIYSNEKLNDRLLQIALFYFEKEELAKEFFAKPRGGAEEIQEEPTKQAQEELKIDQETVDEAKIAITTRAQHRFLLFRWGQFVARLEIDVPKVFNKQDVTDEKLIKLAKAQFNVLLNGR
jgi:hypothetical protein